MIEIINNDLQFFSFLNHNNFNIDDSQLCAKAIKTDVEKKFYILVSGESDLFNPLDSNHVRLQKDYERGGLKYKLKQCKEQTYKEYVRFLKSKNKTDYMCAQRSYLNG